MNTVYGHASMIAMGTLNIPQASFHREAPSAWDSARKASAHTSLAVMIFAFPEGQLKDHVTILGGFEEGRALTREEARARLASGYVPTPVQHPTLAQQVQGILDASGFIRFDVTEDSPVVVTFHRGHYQENSHRRLTLAQMSNRLMGYGLLVEERDSALYVRRQEN
jgi:hypothetical protein